MHEEELGHKAAFDKLMAERRVRPTVLLPLWNIAGFALGKLPASLQLQHRVLNVRENLEKLQESKGSLC